MKKRNSLVVIIILIVAIISVSVGYVIAETTGNTINAAYNLKTGIMRFLSDPNDYNPKAEAPISWNIQGVPGTPGAPGAPGAGLDNIAYAVNNRAGQITSNDFGLGGLWTATLNETTEGDPNPSPSVTVNITSGKALVMISARMRYGEVGFQVSGSTNRAVDQDEILVVFGHEGDILNTAGAQFIVTDLNNGSTTFTMMYRGDVFDQRSLIVVPLP